MHRSLARLRSAALALLAALALAVLPTLARALEPMSATPVWADLCRNTDAPATAHALQACGYCTLAAAPLLPVSAMALAFHRAGQPPAPAIAWAGLPIGPVGAAAAARAPPGQA